MKKRPSRPIDKKIFGNEEKLRIDPTTLDTPERVLAYCQTQGFIKRDATDIESVIKKNENLSLSFEDMGINDASIKKISENKYHITINSRHSKTRQAFSMAHEYAHYQLHRDELAGLAGGEQILHRNEEKNKIEYQANQFAAEILMPESTFKIVVKAKNGDISEIAKEFLVSPLAVRYRAKSLGMGGHGL
jgi:Zn-dependent peptidase ImmA (M78 family)